MSTTTSTKYQTVRNKLEAAIRSGEFTTGDQIPAEQTLAEQYGVSLMTARRVVCDLVTADLLERRARKGTFVRQNAMEKVTTTTLNLVVAAYDTSFQRIFLNQGMRLAEEKGWRGNVIRLGRGQQDAAVRAIQDGELAILMVEELAPQSALSLTARGARGRVVSIGRDATRIGIPSICVDVFRCFQLVLEYLRALGHQDIVLVTQKTSQEFDDFNRSAWKRATAEFYTEVEADQHCLSLDTPTFQCPSFDAYSVVRQRLSERTPTALVCFGEEITQGALAACRSTGHNIPETISFVNILDAPSMIFAHPPITSLDVDFEKQIQIALELLDPVRGDDVPDARLHVVEPFLSDRGSAVPPPNKERSSQLLEGIDHGQFFHSR